MTLPNFLICGAPKAGTTSLFQYLQEHPDVFMPENKEPNYFNVNWDRGREWYESLFVGAGACRAIGEGSVWNMRHPDAAGRIHGLIPDAKLIFVLRNPIERIHSEYWYNVMRGARAPSLTFSKMIRLSEDQPESRGLLTGRYIEHLQRFERLFGRDQMLILLFDDFREDTPGTMRRVFEFLGVDPDYRPNVEKRHNVTSTPKHAGVYRAVHAVWRPFRGLVASESGAGRALKGLRDRVRLWMYAEKKPDPMSESDRQFLREYYAEPNRLLGEYLGRDLSHWT